MADPFLNRPVHVMAGATNGPHYQEPHMAHFFDLDLESGLHTLAGGKGTGIAIYSYNFALPLLSHDVLVSSLSIKKRRVALLCFIMTTSGP